MQHQMGATRFSKGGQSGMDIKLHSWKKFTCWTYFLNTPKIHGGFRCASESSPDFKLGARVSMEVIVTS